VAVGDEQLQRRKNLLPLRPTGTRVREPGESIFSCKTPLTGQKRLFSMEREIIFDEGRDIKVYVFLRL
jgi:hypothetical protein